MRGSFLQAVLAEAGLATCGEAKAFGLYLMLVRPPGFYFGEVRPKAEPNQNKTLAPNKKNLDKLLRQYIIMSNPP